MSTLDVGEPIVDKFCGVIDEDGVPLSRVQIWIL